MKKILISPIFNYPANYFTGDNVSYYHPGKYLWHVCNIAKTGFYQPVYDFYLNEDVSLTYIFYTEQPQHLYFKKPQWIDQFKVAENEEEVNRIAKSYDFFTNMFRYRGAPTPEVNSGYSSDLPEINLYLVAYTYKAVFDHGLYVDDLELTEKYIDFLKNVNYKINPEDRPVVAIHARTDDPWERHLPDYIKLNEQLLFNLMDIYPEHTFVLVGDPYSWRYFHHSRIKYLRNYINRNQMLKYLNEYTSCLQYILAAYFCRNVDLIYIGISGFTLFLESIRPLNLMPPIPIFWGPETFTGVDTCLKKLEFFCPEFEKYKSEHPEDSAFQHYCHHFLYYSRNEEILKPYCLDYPNNQNKVFRVLSKLENKYERAITPYLQKTNAITDGRKFSPYAADSNPEKESLNINYRGIKSNWYENFSELTVNYAWSITQVISNISQRIHAYWKGAKRRIRLILNKVKRLSSPNLHTKIGN